MNTEMLVITQIQKKYLDNNQFLLLNSPMVLLVAIFQKDFSDFYEKMLVLG